jgi:hypothetical protein
MAAVTAPWGHAGPSRAQGSGRPRWPLASQRGRTLSRCRPSPTLRPEERGPSAAGGDADRTPGPHPPPPLPAGPRRCSATPAETSPFPGFPGVPASSLGSFSQRDTELKKLGHLERLTSHTLFKNGGGRKDKQA